MRRRDFVKLGCAAAASLGAPKLASAQASQSMPPMPEMPAAPQAAAPAGKADFTLRNRAANHRTRAEHRHQHDRLQRQLPGPLMRVREGKQVTVDVINDTDMPELVHWHGMYVPSEVDGAEEEGTPLVPPHGRRRYQFVARPAGRAGITRMPWPWSICIAAPIPASSDFLLIESANDPGRYDQELFLALRDWEPFLPRWTEEGAGPQRSNAEKPGQARHAPERLGSRLPHLLDQRQIAGRGRTDSREARPARTDALAECQRQQNRHCPAGPQVSDRRARRQSGAYAENGGLLQLAPASASTRSSR